MKAIFNLVIAMLLAPLAALHADEHLIQPGDNPQDVMDRAAPGDRIVFQPGLHLHHPGKHRALLYVAKSVEIELKQGATLKLADNATKLEAAPEITTDQDAGKKLDDMEVGGAFDLSKPSIFTIVMDSEGSDGQLRNVKCNHNYMETAVTAIEPNFNLDGYEVIGNVIKSGGNAIHCWRHSKNGAISDNLRIHDNTGKPVVVLGAPRGWEQPQPPTMKNNRNHLGEAASK